ncbi:hypothetical protein ACL02O_06830 [Micromonospora sp. MS34]
MRQPLPRIAVGPGQPAVAVTPSNLVGSAVTMTGLRVEGIVDLPTGDGTMKAIKFAMDQAVIEDFLLRAPAPAGRTMLLTTQRATLRGKVGFYITRFTGRLLGTELTLTPDRQDFVPIAPPNPVTFTDLTVDLAFVSSDSMTAWPKLGVRLE